MTTTTVGLTLTHIECWHCHAVYGLNEESRRRYKETGKTWVCPYCGKSTGYGQTVEQELRERLARMERDRQFWINQSQQMGREKVALRHQVRAHKAVATKLRKRVQHGVCPVPGCKRHFTNLERHMHTKHPRWTPPPKETV